MKNELRIPKDSKWPIGTVVCAVIMTILEFWSFWLADGEFVSFFSMPAVFVSKVFGLGYFITKLLEFLVPITLLLFTILFAKKEIRLLNIPILLSFVSFNLFPIGLMFLIKAAFFYGFLYICLLVIFFLTSFGKLKNKVYLVGITAAFSIIIIVIAFAPSRPVLSILGELSNYISLAAFYAGYAFLGIAMKNVPLEECEEQTQRNN